MASIEYYGGGNDVVFGEIKHWVKTIGDCREACQRFTDNIKTGLERTQQFSRSGTMARPVTFALIHTFQHSFEHTYANYLDIWKEFDEEGSPYHRLARLTDADQQKINRRIRRTWANHRQYEKEVLDKKEDYEKLMQNYQQEKEKLLPGETRTYNQKLMLIDMKSKMKLALVKYRIAFKEEYEHRSITSQSLEDIADMWQRKERTNLRLLSDTLIMFKRIILALAPEEQRSSLKPIVDRQPMNDQDIQSYVNALYVSGRRRRNFLYYEGPVDTNPIVPGDPQPEKCNGEKENKVAVIQNGGWGPFKTYVCLTESATGILRSPDDYTGKESEPFEDDQPTLVDSLVSRLENVRLVAIRIYAKREPREISLKPGTVVVQVHAANERGMCYGYKKGSLGLRRYGYYPADAVSLK